MIAALSWLACTPGPDPALADALEAQRSEARIVMSEVTGDFSPDLVLHLSPRTVANIVEVGLLSAPHIKDKREIVGAVVSTELHVEHVALKRPDGESDFVAVVELEGETTINGGLFGKLTVPIHVESLVSVAVSTETDRDMLRVDAAPKAVRDVTFRIDGVPGPLLALLREPSIREPIRARIEAEILALPPFHVASWRRAGLPVRGFRVVPEGAGLRVEMLSTAVHPGDVRPDAGRAVAGFRLDASLDSLLWLAKTEAFARNPVDLRKEAQRQLPERLKEHAPEIEILPIPTSLSVDGDQFTLGVRLWRMVEDPGADPAETRPLVPAWWRDYVANGSVAITDGEIALTVGTISAGESSPRAGRADPLATLAQTLLLSTVTDPLQQSLPASGATKVAGHAIEVELTDVHGESGMLRVAGDLSVNDSP